MLSKVSTIRKMISEIFIYEDYGSSEFCVDQLFKCLKLIYKDKYKISKITAKNITQDEILSNKENEKLLCIGGGFDLGYLKSLQDNGMQRIRRFVQSGGNYLGICAGAYFATGFVEFDINGKLEVVGERYLNFFNGKSIGPINKKFIYNCDDEAMAIKIKINRNQSENYVYLNGGCYFEPNQNENHNMKIVASYVDLDKESSIKLHDSVLDNSHSKIAIVETQNENGKCLLSGVHFEINLFDLNLDNQNIKENLFDKLKSSSNSKHSNYDLIKYLLQNTFNL